MNKTVILRFRDLVTEEGGTIIEHSNLLHQFGEVWWGWWMRQYETPPYSLFQELSDVIQGEGELSGYLFNVGTAQLYKVKISRILVAPPGNRIATPDPERSPGYYHRGSYPAWFLLRSLDELNFSDVKFIYDSFPTRLDLQVILLQMLGQHVASLEQLRQIDVTLYVVQAEFSLKA